MSSKVLIVEDEIIVAKDIQNTILQLNFKVAGIVNRVEEVLSCVKTNEPDIILMDINLNDRIDGIELVEEIYKIKYIPVIYLTSYDDDLTINKAIQTNPVGYLLKPFSRGELKSTILLGLYKANQSSKSLEPKKYKKIGFDYYFDIINKNLYYKDMLVKLGSKEMKFLNLLIFAEGETVSHQKIEYEVWSNTFVSDSTIRTLVYRLRAKLNADLIIREPLLGYKLNVLK